MALSDANYLELEAAGSYQAAYEACARYLTTLRENAAAPRVSADGASHDPSTYAALIPMVQADLVRLRAIVTGIGRPRLIPTRRADPRRGWRGAG